MEHVSVKVDGVGIVVKQVIYQGLIQNNFEGVTSHQPHNFKTKIAILLIHGMTN